MAEQVLGGIKLAPPAVTQRDEMTLRVEDGPARLMHPGAAHTTTATVVWLYGWEPEFTGALDEVLEYRGSHGARIDADHDPAREDAAA